MSTKVIILMHETIDHGVCFGGQSHSQNIRYNFFCVWVESLQFWIKVLWAFFNKGIQICSNEMRTSMSPTLVAFEKNKTK